MRATFVAARAFLVVMSVLSLLSGCGSREPAERAPTPAQARAQLAGSPPPLAALHAQAAQLLDGGLDAYEARLKTLEGRPVVANVWASWCDPCEFEMPWFSRAGVRFGRRVAFVGVNAGDFSQEKARAFLHEHFVPYPSYDDPHNQIAQEIGVRAGLPTTVFYGRDGAVAYVHQGRYRDEDALVADIRRYAGAS